MEETLAQMETPRSPGKPEKAIEHVFSQEEFDANIRKAKEEAELPRREREAAHGAATSREGTLMLVWCFAANILLTVAIIVALVKANYEVALLAGGVLCFVWFYMHGRLHDALWIRGPRADDKPPS